ncbi:Reverse transcriptase zinc-binding domain [Sesbania bispinosa]|nr:Reverse transcriptase zinc-binding domain [Sesbania bispinosa]
MGFWHFNSLYTSIQPAIQNSLPSLKPTICEGVQDLITWDGSLMGLYSAKDGYSWLLAQIRDFGHQNIGSWVWKLEASESIRFMLWQSVFGVLPTKALLHLRHLSASSYCPICATREEDVLHCLRDCLLPSSVWLCLGLSSFPEFSQTTNPYDWVRWCASSFGSLFLAVVWLIWKSRNEFFFEKKNQQTRMFLFPRQFSSLVLCPVFLPCG